jgi:transposase
MYPSDQLLQMKEKMLKKVLAKEMKLQEVAEIFGVTRQSTSKWLAKYKYGGMAELVPKKSGPKNGTCWNKTSDKIENRVVEIAKEHLFKGPDWISDELFEEGIKIDQSTISHPEKEKDALLRKLQAQKTKEKIILFGFTRTRNSARLLFPMGISEKSRCI